MGKQMGGWKERPKRPTPNREDDQSFSGTLNNVEKYLTN